MRKIYIKALSVSTLTLLLTPVFALALPDTCNEFLAFIGTASQTMAAFVGAIAVLMLLLGAFKLLVSGGDPEKIGTARASIVWTIIAIVVALFAFTLPTIVADFLGGTLLTSCV